MLWPVAAGALLEPDTIGPYRVIRPLARGGMASVYEVEDASTHERFALKLLTQPGLAIPRFNREYRALSRLNHANIVRVYRFGLTDEAQPYLTMELLDGVPAQVHAKSCGRPGTPRRTLEVIRIVGAVADALDYLHERSIIHRDLKSSNVLVQRDGSVKLLDFGTARLVESLDQITRHGEFIGTFAYASPEQLTGRTVDGQADLYSLGVLFYRLLTGKRPFEAQSLHELAKMHLEKPPRPLSELAPGIPEPVAELVIRMLAKSPADRPQGAKAVVDALRAWTRSARGAPSASGPSLLPARLVGRDDELALMREILAAPKDGTMVVLSGPTGSGRVRIVQQMSAEAREKGWRVYEASFPGPPGLGALGEIARIVARSLPGSESVVEEDVLTRESSDTDPSFNSVRTRIFERIAESFVERARADNRPMGLFLHDLHKAPPLAIDALVAIRERSKALGQPIVVFTSCAEEATRPSQPLRAQFHDAHHIRLLPIRPDEMQALVASMLGLKTPPGELARRVYEASGGLPGYGEEVVRAMVQEGLLLGKQVAGSKIEWLDRSDGRVAIPASTREAIGQRLDALPRGLGRFLDGLALAGGEAQTHVLAHACDVSAAETRSALHDLAFERVLTRKEHQGVETWHFRLGLMKELVLERLRDNRRQVLERRLAEALWEAPTSRDKLRILEAAGFIDRAIEESTAWVDAVLETRHGAEVLGILDRLVARVGEVKALPPTQVARLFLAHGRALTANDPKDPRADESFRRAAVLSTAASLRSEVDLHVAKLLHARGDVSRAVEALARAQGRLETSPNPELQAEVSQLMGDLAMSGGDLPGALQHFQAARRMGEHLHQGPVEARARVGCARVRIALGELTAAENDLLHAGEAFARVRDEPGRWTVALESALVYRHQGRFSDAISALEANLPNIRKSSRAAQSIRTLVMLIEVEIDLYRLGEAREHLAEIMALGAGADDPPLAASVARARGRLLLAADEPAQAAGVLLPALEVAEKRELGVEAHAIRAYLGQARGLIGDRREADQLTKEAIQGLLQARHVPALADACICRWTALDGRENPDTTFGPLLPWLDSEPARLAKLIYLLASAEYAYVSKHPSGGRLYDAARQLRDEIGGLLSPVDRHGLEVHPWTTRIARGLPAGM
jgi:tetratricopeptide (TPR) repeat protein